MRILFLSGEYPPLAGGIADYTAQLAGHLAAGGDEITVLASVGAAEVPGSAVRVLGRVRTWGFQVWPEIWRLARGFDLIHVQYQAANFQLKGAIPLLADAMRLSGGPPVVTTFHDLRIPYLFPKAGPLRAAAVRRLARASAAVVTTNEEDEQTLKGWGLTALWQIPLGTNIPPALPADFDRDGWRARWGVTPEQFLIVYFGFVNHTKGVADLLHAQDRLLRAAQPAKVMLLGDPLGASDPTNVSALREMEALAETLNLDDGWLIQTGAMPPEEIAAGMAAADVVALPYHDGASLRRTTLITALAHGRPVVTTTPAVPVAALRDNETVALVPPATPSDLARRLAMLLRYAPSRERLARGASALAPHFAWEGIAARHRALYQTVLGRGHPSME